jgi:hypothetical protein
MSFILILIIIFLFLLLYNLKIFFSKTYNLIETYLQNKSYSYDTPYDENKYIIIDNLFKAEKEIEQSKKIKKAMKDELGID